VTVSVAVLAVLARSLDLRASGVLEALSGARPELVLAALGWSLGVQVVLGSDKLRRVLAAAGCRVGFAETVAVRMGVGPLRLLLPGRAGGLLVGVYFWRLHGLSAGRASGVLAFDRALNLFGTLVWLGAGLLWLLGGRSPMTLVAVAAGLAGVLLVFFSGQLHRRAPAWAGVLHPRIGRFVGETLAPIAEISPSHRAGLLAYGVVYQSAPFVICALLFAALGVSVEPAAVVAFTSAASLAGHVPGPLAGIGPREAALVGLFSGAAPAELLLGVGLLLSLLVQVVPKLVGAPLLPWFLARVGRPWRSG